MNEACIFHPRHEGLETGACVYISRVLRRPIFMSFWSYNTTRGSIKLHVIPPQIITYRPQGRHFITNWILTGKMSWVGCKFFCVLRLEHLMGRAEQSISWRIYLLQRGTGKASCGFELWGALFPLVQNVFNELYSCSRIRHRSTEENSACSTVQLPLTAKDLSTSITSAVSLFSLKMYRHGNKHCLNLSWTCLLPSHWSYLCNSEWLVHQLHKRSHSHILGSAVLFQLATHHQLPSSICCYIHSS